MFSIHQVTFTAIPAAFPNFGFALHTRTGVGRHA